MKTPSNIVHACTFLGILALAIWGASLAVIPSSKAHAAGNQLPGCDEARTIDQVRDALEGQSGRKVLGLYSPTETHATDEGDFRRCTATVVTEDQETAVSYAIGWHDRENAVPFWAGDGLPKSQ